MDKTFSQWKQQCLSKVDLSKKGSVDQDIEHIVTLLNGLEQFFTTSSCSGRIIIIDTAVSLLSALQKVKYIYTVYIVLSVACDSSK